MLARGNSFNKRVAMTASSTAYTTGKVIGVPTALAGAVANPGGTGTLISLLVQDMISQSKDIDFYFFDRLPTTQGGDGATYALTDAESAYLLGKISVATADYSVGSSENTEATKQGLALGLRAYNGTSVYVVAVARASVTFTGDNLYIRPHIRQD